MLVPSLREAFALDWNGLAIGHALRRSIVLWAFVAASLYTHNIDLAVFPIVGAVVVGYGSIRALGTTRATPMFACSLGIALATFLGSLAGGSALYTGIALAAAGLGFGFLASAGPGTTWAALNCLVFFLVIGLPFPGAPPVALHYALLVLAGSLGQSITLTIMYVIRRRMGVEEPGTWFLSGAQLRDQTKKALRSIFRGPEGNREALIYGLRMAAALELGQALGKSLHLQRTAWILMTSALVLKPDLRQTLSRGLGRCGGTLVGGLVATMLAAWCAPGPAALSALLVVSAGLSYLVFYVNYALSTVFLTAYVVFLLAFAGLPGPNVALLRVVATVAGGAIALLVCVPWSAD